MTRTAVYLKQLMALARRPSVYAVAQLMELPYLHVHSWYRGKSKPDTLSCVKIAELLVLHPLQVIAEVEAEREKDAGRKARWTMLAKRWALPDTGSNDVWTNAPRSKPKAPSLMSSAALARRPRAN